MQEFEINKYITLKLEGDTTVIYVTDKELMHCKYLLLTIPTKTIKSFDAIDSIDEAAEKLDQSREWNDDGAKNIPPMWNFGVIVQICRFGRNLIMIHDFSIEIWHFHF